MRPAALITVIVAIAIIIGAFFLWNNREQQLPFENGNGSPDETSMIKVTAPLPGSLVRSPLTVRGEARGNWYFEASFPMKLLDGNGKELAVSHAQAQGEWMTTEFVPFVGTISFSVPTTPTGTLVLEKDNPSGLPGNAAEVRIPVRFDTATQEQTVKLYYYDQSRDKDASGNVLCSSKGLVAVDRNTSVTVTPIQDSIRMLLRGELTQAERARGITTEFPLPGVELRSASLTGGILTLTFADPQNKTTGGSCRVSILRAQIEATAKQFSGVNQVRFMPAGVFEP